MACPPLKIPWPRWAVGEKPNGEQEHENYQALERWASGMLKCQCADCGGGAAEGGWITGSAPSINPAAGTTGTHVIEYDYQEWMTDGFSLTNGGGSYDGIQVPYTGWYMVTASMSFVSTSVPSDTLGTIAATGRTYLSVYRGGGYAFQFHGDDTPLWRNTATAYDVKRDVSALVYANADEIIVPLAYVESFVTYGVGTRLSYVSLQVVFQGEATKNELVIS